MIDKNIKVYKTTDFNAYLKQFVNKYKLYLDSDGCWKILCKYGSISPYDIAKGELICNFEFKSKNILTKHRDKLVIKCFSDTSLKHERIILDSSIGYSFILHIDNIATLGVYLGLTPIVRMSKEQFTRMHDRLVVYDADKMNKKCSYKDWWC